MSKYYYHGTDSLEVMLNIISSGSIKSPILLGKDSCNGYNWPNYVSVCNKSNPDAYTDSTYNAYMKYIYNSYCFIISSEVDAIKTEFINPREYGLESKADIYKFMMNNPNIRYSDLFDEYQVMDEILLKYIIGIGIPINLLVSLHEFSPRAYENKIATGIKKLINISNELALNIVNTSDEYFIEKYESGLSADTELEKIKRYINE